MNNSSMAGCTPALCRHVSCIWRSIVVMRSGQARETGTPPTPAELGQAPGRSPQKLTRPRAQPPASVSTTTYTYHSRVYQYHCTSRGPPTGTPRLATQAKQRPWGGATRETGRRARGFDYERVAAVSATSPARRACLQAPSGCGGDGEY